MNAIDELLAEHEAVRRTLGILRRINREIETTGTIPHMEHLDHLVEFFSVFVDRCHHGKEEALLFPALEQVGISRRGGPVGVMLEEHQQGRDLVARMKKAVSRCRGGEAAAARDVRRAAETYIALLDRHIEKENTVLFPLAVQHLPEHRLAEMKKGFDAIEAEKIGPGRHEQFHTMLDQLERHYGP